MSHNRYVKNHWRLSRGRKDVGTTAGSAFEFVRLGIHDLMRADAKPAAAKVDGGKSERTDQRLSISSSNGCAKAGRRSKT
jgi:hypothetical protein